MKRTIATLIATIAATSASAGDQVFVGGPAGAVYVADSDTGDFTYFACFCIGPIVSIQPYASDLLVADTFGGLWILDGITGNFENGAWTGLQAQDMALDGDTPLVVNHNGDIHRINMDTGQTAELITTPSPATSILTFDGRIFAGLADGTIVSRQSAESGWNTLHQMPDALASITIRPDGLIAVDVEGNTSRVDPNVGGPIDGYYAGTGITDSAVAGDSNIFTGGANGNVYIFDNNTGLQTDTWTAPIAVDAVFVRPGSVCQADVNRNAILDAGDFTAWLAAFNRGDFDADQNTDLQLTPADFTAWLANFSAGCD